MRLNHLLVCLEGGMSNWHEPHRGTIRHKRSRTGEPDIIEVKAKDWATSADIDDDGLLFHLSAIENSAGANDRRGKKVLITRLTMHFRVTPFDDQINSNFIMGVLYDHNPKTGSFPTFAEILTSPTSNCSISLYNFKNLSRFDILWEKRGSISGGETVGLFNNSYRNWSIDLDFGKGLPVVYGGVTADDVLSGRLVFFMLGADPTSTSQSGLFIKARTYFVDD